MSAVDEITTTTMEEEIKSPEDDNNQSRDENTASPFGVQLPIDSDDDSVILSIEHTHRKIEQEAPSNKVPQTAIVTKWFCTFVIMICLTAELIMSTLAILYLSSKLSLESRDEAELLESTRAFAFILIILLLPNILNLVRAVWNIRCCEVQLPWPGRCTWILIAAYSISESFGLAIVAFKMFYLQCGPLVVLVMYSGLVALTVHMFLQICRTNSQYPRISLHYHLIIVSTISCILYVGFLVYFCVIQLHLEGKEYWHFVPLVVLSLVWLPWFQKRILMQYKEDRKENIDRETENLVHSRDDNRSFGPTFATSHYTDREDSYLKPSGSDEVDIAFSINSDTVGRRSRDKEDTLVKVEVYNALEHGAAIDQIHADDDIEDDEVDEKASLLQERGLGPTMDSSSNAEGEVNEACSGKARTDGKTKPKSYVVQERAPFSLPGITPPGEEIESQKGNDGSNTLNEGMEKNPNLWKIVILIAGLNIIFLVIFSVIFFVFDRNENELFSLKYKTFAEFSAYFSAHNVWADASFRDIFYFISNIVFTILAYQTVLFYFSSCTYRVGFGIPLLSSTTILVGLLTDKHTCSYLFSENNVLCTDFDILEKGLISGATIGITIVQSILGYMIYKGQATAIRKEFQTFCIFSEEEPYPSDLDSDEDYQPSINFSFRPNNADDLEEVTFAGAEFGEVEECEVSEMKTWTRR